MLDKVTSMSIRTYSELIAIPTFEERFKYLSLDGSVGEYTFGGRRELNQMLYRTDEWKIARRDTIIRDNGCDLGMIDYEILGTIVVHHMNPITIEDIINRNPKIFDLEYLISTAVMTHKAIHYSDENLLPKGIIERTANDMCPWRH